MQSLDEWFWPLNSGQGDVETVTKGGELKRAGKLSFVTVDNAGHTSPRDAPKSMGFMVNCWLNGDGPDGPHSCP
jgi:hypothetical protein